MRTCPPRLVPRLQSLFSGLKHVRQVDLREADDRAIWEWAKANADAAATTDFDFVTMNQRFGWPPKLIHIDKCDLPFLVIEDLLGRSAVLITEFDNHESAGVLKLHVPHGRESR